MLAPPHRHPHPGRHLTLDTSCFFLRVFCCGDTPQNHRRCPIFSEKETEAQRSGAACWRSWSRQPIHAVNPSLKHSCYIAGGRAGGGGGGLASLTGTTAAQGEGQAVWEWKVVSSRALSLAAILSETL